MLFVPLSAYINTLPVLHTMQLRMAGRIMNDELDESVCSLIELPSRHFFGRATNKNSNEYWVFPGGKAAGAWC
jgi:hypothetical protein